MPSISLAVMVKNDAVRLQRCMDSVRDAVDEMVVLDTGSTDDTIAVARAAGARVEEMEWPGSFSAGLNALLPLVKTDWVLRLDSDEWFESSPFQALHDAMGRSDHFGFMLVRRDILPENRHRDIAIFRLWRNHPALRYEGRVHENISNESIEDAYPGMKVSTIPLWFWHDGYSQGSEGKLRRNLELLEEELSLHPAQPYYRAMRATTLLELGDPGAKSALQQVVDEALAEKKPATRLYVSVFISFLQSATDEELRSAMAQRVIERAWTWFAGYPAVVWALGLAETRRGSPKAALEAYLHLEKLAETGRFERTMPFDPAILGVNLWQALGYTAQQLGRMDVMARCGARLAGS